MATEPFIIPTVGSSGFFTLREPFASQINGTVRYTCQAVRRISDYISNNEDVKADVYTKNSLPEDVWLEDMQSDASIISLQSEVGHWLYVPVRYNVSYPNTNGIPYRSMAFAINLPAMPANRDYSDVTTALSNAIMDSLGVACEIRLLETSLVSLIDSDVHAQKQAQRDALRDTQTDRGRYMSTLQQLASANQKISELETYAIAHP